MLETKESSVMMIGVIDTVSRCLVCGRSWFGHEEGYLRGEHACSRMIEEDQHQEEVT